MATASQILLAPLGVLAVVGLVVIVSAEFARRLRAEFEQCDQELQVGMDARMEVVDEHLMQVSRGLDKIEWEVMELTTKQRVEVDGLKAEIAGLRALVEPEPEPTETPKPGSAGGSGGAPSGPRLAASRHY